MLDIKCYLCGTELISNNVYFFACHQCPIYNYCGNKNYSFVISFHNDRASFVDIAFVDIKLRIIYYNEYLSNNEDKIEIRKVPVQETLDSDIVTSFYMKIPNLLDIPPEVLKNKIKTWATFS